MLKKSSCSYYIVIIIITTITIDVLYINSVVIF